MILLTAKSLILIFSNSQNRSPLVNSKDQKVSLGEQMENGLKRTNTFAATNFKMDGRGILSHPCMIYNVNKCILF